MTDAAPKTRERRLVKRLDTNEYLTPGFNWSGIENAHDYGTLGFEIDLAHRHARLLSMQRVPAVVVVRRPKGTRITAGERAWRAWFIFSHPTTRPPAYADFSQECRNDWAHAAKAAGIPVERRRKARKR